MGFSIYYGSGRAKCVICGRQIKENELQIHYGKNAGVHSASANAHWSCIEDKKDYYVLRTAGVGK